MRSVVAAVLTVAVLFAYGGLLKWAYAASHWWVFVLAFTVPFWIGYKMDSPDERREFVQELRRLIGIGRR